MPLYPYKLMQNYKNQALYDRQILCYENWLNEDQ